MGGSVAVFDVGKTNVKLIVFDRDGKVVAERSQPNAPLPPDARWPYLRLDTERAWAFLLASLKDVGAATPIEAVSVAAHGAAGALVAEDTVAAPPVDYEFDGFAGVDAEYDSAPSAVRRDLLAASGARPQSRAANLLSRADMPGRFRPRPRLSRLPAVLVVAAVGRGGLGSHIARRARRPLAAKRRKAVEPGRPGRLGPAVPAVAQSLGHARSHPSRGRRGDRTAGGRQGDLRRARFECFARSLSRLAQRPVHRRFDRNLGDHHGGRRRRDARPERRHDRQCRRSGPSGADGAFDGRTRVRRPRGRAAGGRGESRRRGGRRLGRHGHAGLHRSGRAVRRPQGLDRGPAAADARRPGRARDPLFGADDRPYAPAARGAGRHHRRGRLQPDAGLFRPPRRTHARAAGVRRPGLRRRRGRGHAGALGRAARAPQAGAGAGMGCARAHRLRGAMASRLPRAAPEA